MIYTFMHLKFAMTKEAIHLCTVQENDPNLTGKKYILIQQCILEKFLVSSFFISRNFLLAFLPFDNYLGEFLPVYKVGHVVVAHFCQLEDILDDKPANDNDYKRDDVGKKDRAGHDNDDHGGSSGADEDIVGGFCAVFLFANSFCPLLS